MNSGGRFFLLLMACFPACYGSVGDTPQHGPVATRPSAPGMTAGGPPAATPGGTTGTAPPASPPDTLAAPYPVRRLSPDEYVNSVADLLGLTGTEQQALALDLPADVTGATGFGAPGLMGADEVRRFAEKGHQAAALRDPGVVAGCDPNTGGATCVRHFVDTFAARAFRRPLLGSEGDDLVQLYQTLRAQGLSPSDGLRELLATLLQTPQFLYHRELGGAEPGTGPAGLALTPFQVAARLSYLFWRTLPDSRLAQAAAQGQLTSPVDREREARRLLQDPRANRAVERFFLDTLSFDDVQRISKNVTDATFPAAVRSALMDEATLYVDHWFAEDGTLGGLLTSSATYLDSRSAEHYGLGNVTGTQRVVLPAAARAGLLTLGAVMAVNASPDEGSPIKRGALVRQRILCQKLPPHARHRSAATQPRHGTNPARTPQPAF